MISYDTLPFKVFHLILNDPEENIHLLGIDDKEEAFKAWDNILEQWKERHPSPDERDLLVGVKNALTKTIRLGKLVACLKFMIVFRDVDEEKQKEVFRMARVEWVDDPLKRLQKMNRMLEKAKTEKEIFDGRLQKLSEELKEKQSSRETSNSKLTVADVNKSIASLELAGFTVDNYETLTCGKYDAMSAVIREQNRKLEKHGTR